MSAELIGWIIGLSIGIPLVLLYLLSDHDDDWWDHVA